MMVSWFQLKPAKTSLPSFTSDLYRSLVNDGKIVNQELIILQHHAAYRLVCFRV